MNLFPDSNVSFTFVRGKSCTTSSCLILQVGNEAKVDGCSGAMQVAYPIFIETWFLQVPKGEVKTLVEIIPRMRNE